MWPFGGKKQDADGVDKPEKKNESAQDASDRVFKDEKEDEALRPEKGSMPGFDAKALERAAAAARELEGLSFAKEAVEIAKLKEERRGKQALAEAEENKVRQKAMEVERTRAQEAERRKTIEQDYRYKQEQEHLADRLARKRHADQLEAQRQQREQQIRREEEFQLRVEQMKRQTAEYEAKLRKDSERARAEAESEGRAKAERLNWDLHMQRAKMEQGELRGTILQSVREAGQMVGNGISSFLQDREKLTTTVGFLTAIGLGLYGAKVSTGVAGRFIESRLGKPPLVRETSRTSLLKPFAALRQMAARSGAGSALDGVVVAPKLGERLQTLAVSTKNARRNGAPYRHALLYGPPGTGKTLFAKKLAQSSGMDFAVMTGGDVAPLGRDAVSEIHKLFDWADSSGKGLCLFIDEADAFLRKRVNTTMSEDQRNALNAFLYRTGTESRNFMVVYATNEPDQLDWAITDRTDELVKFELPGEAEREQILDLYFNKHVKNAHLNAKKGVFSSVQQISVDPAITKETLKKVALRTKGFSGRELAKLCISWSAAAYASANATFTPQMMDRVLDDSLEQHMSKLKWDVERLELE